MEAWNREFNTTVARLMRANDKFGMPTFSVVGVPSRNLSYGYGMEALCDAAFAAVGELDIGGKLGGIFLMPYEFMEYVVHAKVPERFRLAGKTPAETRSIYQNVVHDMSERGLLFTWDKRSHRLEQPLPYAHWQVALAHNSPYQLETVLH